MGREGHRAVKYMSDPLTVPEIGRTTVVLQRVAY